MDSSWTIDSLRLSARRTAASQPCGNSPRAKWPGAGLNRRHRDSQSRALPTELPGRSGVAVNTGSAGGGQSGPGALLELRALLASREGDGPGRALRADAERRRDRAVELRRVDTLHLPDERRPLLR